MKHSSTLNKKWILTASLLAVLSTQYSFESSSQKFNSASAVNNYGEFVLASKSGDPTKVDDLNNNNKIKTEAMSITDCPDGTCKTIVLSPTNSFKLSMDDFAKFTALFKIANPTTTPVTTAAVANPDSDCEPYSPTETAQEKRDRIKCEKEEKKTAKEDAKKAKEEELKEKLQEKFQEKVDALSDKCNQDLECLSSGFTSILSRFDGKKSLPDSTVKEAFKSAVGPSLKKALVSGDLDAMENAQSLLQDMPEKYKSLKQNIILAVKAQATITANKVSAEYSAVNELAKQNKTQEYFQALATAQQDHQNLNTMVLSYSRSIEQSLSSSQDTSTIAFYQKSYVPDMNKIMAAVISGVQTLDPKNNTRNDRNGATGVNGTGSTALPVQEKMTRDNSNWTVPSTNQGVQFGTPANQSRGGRGPNLNF